MEYVVDLAYSNSTTQHINGQDVNVPMDWSQVIPLDGVITKVSELNFVDETFIPNWHGILARGFPRAGYHFYRNGQLFWNSARQAATFVNAIKAQGFKDGDYFVCDNEEKDSHGNSLVSIAETLDWFYNVMLGLGLPDYSRFWLYSTADILNNLNLSKLDTAQLAILKSIKIWVAGYLNNPPSGDILTALPGAYMPNQFYFGKVIGWQYQENAIVPTIPGGCDLNQIDPDFLASWKNTTLRVTQSIVSAPTIITVPSTPVVTPAVDPVTQIIEVHASGAQTIYKVTQ